MSPAENSLFPLFLWNFEVTPEVGVRVVAEDRNDCVVLVENDHTAMQVGDRDKVAVDGDRGGHAETGDDFRNEITIEVVMEQASFGLMITVANQQARGS